MAERCVPKLGQKDPNEKSGNWHRVDSNGSYTEINYNGLNSPIKVKLESDIKSTGYDRNKIVFRDENGISTVNTDILNRSGVTTMLNNISQTLRANSTIVVRQINPTSTEIRLQTKSEDASYRFRINDIDNGDTPHKEVILDTISLPKGTKTGLGTEMVGNLLQTAWNMTKTDKYDILRVNLEADIYYGSYVWMDSGFKILEDSGQKMEWGGQGNLSTRTDILARTENYISDVIANFPKQDMTPEEVRAEVAKLKEPFAPFDAFQKTGLGRYLKEGFDTLAKFIDEDKLTKIGYKEKVQIGDIEGIKNIEGLYKEGILAGLAFNAQMELPVDSEESLASTPELDDFSKRFKRKTNNTFDITKQYYEE